jgi:hypothetical protein
LVGIPKGNDNLRDLGVYRGSTEGGVKINWMGGLNLRTQGQGWSLVNLVMNLQVPLAAA